MQCAAVIREYQIKPKEKVTILFPWKLKKILLFRSSSLYKTYWIGLAKTTKGFLQHLTFFTFTGSVVIYIWTRERYLRFLGRNCFSSSSSSSLPKISSILAEVISLWFCSNSSSSPSGFPLFLLLQSLSSSSPLSCISCWAAAISGSVKPFWVSLLCEEKHDDDKDDGSAIDTQKKSGEIWF